MFFQIRKANVICTIIATKSRERDGFRTFGTLADNGMYTLTTQRNAQGKKRNGRRFVRFHCKTLHHSTTTFKPCFERRWHSSWPLRQSQVRGRGLCSDRKDKIVRHLWSAFSFFFYLFQTIPQYLTALGVNEPVPVACASGPFDYW